MALATGAIERMNSLGVWAWLAILEEEADAFSDPGRSALRLLRGDLEKLAVPVDEVPQTTDDTTPCNDCGKPYYERIGTWWRASDSLWLKVVGDVDIALCPGCFAGRAALLGIPIHFEAVLGV